jgi:transcriptional regulator with XRE-family HTH domain
MTKREYLRKLGSNIRRVRESKGFSQDRVCLEGGLSRATMSRIESGSVDVQAWTLFRVAETIGVPVKRLFDF